MRTRVAVCCGVGGTGKTTISAALGVGAAQAGDRVVVLTIDPARRLADALGVSGLDNTPRRIEVPGAAGSLHALMLDRKGAWDEVVRRFASDPAAAERLLGNRYYRAVSTRLTGSHEYMAVEKLHALVESGDWDLVVVDTPPTQHVLDFFRAPERVGRILDRSVLRVLLEPARGLVGVATRRAIGLVENLAGDRVMGDIREFFSLIGGMSGGFRDRAARVAALLASPQTQYYLVTDAEAPERNDILGFLQTLRERGMVFGGFLVNRVTPPPTQADRAELPGEVPGLSAEAWGRWRSALAALPGRARAEAERHRRGARELAAAAGTRRVWLVPDIPGGVRTVEGLDEIARHLPPRAPPV